MAKDKLTEEDRAWLCSCSSYAKVKKPELTVMATSDVQIMLHNLRFEIEELKESMCIYARENIKGIDFYSDEDVIGYFADVAEKHK